MVYDELLRQIEPKLKAICFRLNRNFGQLDQDDLYQEAVLYLWDSYNKGLFCDKTESYIVQGCFFFLKNFIRTALKSVDRLKVSIDGENGYDNDTASVRNLCKISDNNYEVMLIEIAFDEIMESLDTREKEVFSMRLDQYTSREIGSRLGISHTMVGKIESRIREKVKKFL